jgi:hypothetical protein
MDEKYNDEIAAHCFRSCGHGLESNVYRKHEAAKMALETATNCLWDAAIKLIGAERDMDAANVAISNYEAAAKHIQNLLDRVAEDPARFWRAVGIDMKPELVTGENGDGVR